MGASAIPDPASFAAHAGGPVVLYDGECGLCDRAVRFVIASDPAAIFRFAPLQGAFAASVLARHGYSRGREPPDSMILIEAPGTEAEVVRLRSDAVLGIVARLPGAGWRWARWWLRLVPRPIRDLAYALVARVRHRLVGRRESCELPSPEDRRRFL